MKMRKCGGLSPMCKSQREIDSFLDVHNDARKKKTVDSLVDKGYVEISDALKEKSVMRMSAW